MEKIQKFILDAQALITSKFRYATINFAFIMAFIMVIQSIFGANNSIVAVIFVQIMLSTMNRDLTASPIKNYCIQTIVIMFMGVGACLSVNLAPILGLPINFIVMFILLYAYTFEYLDNLYFPYILSYIFFVCLAPIPFSQLPTRLLLILIGCLVMIAYQWIMGRNRMKQTTVAVLLNIMEEASTCTYNTLHDLPFEKDYQKLRSELCKLSKLIYDRRKRTLCISDQAFATIDVGRGLEDLVIYLSQESEKITPLKEALFHQITFYLSCFKSYVVEERQKIPEIDFSHLPLDNKEVQITIQKVSYIRDHLLYMQKEAKKEKYQKTLLSYFYRLQSALHFSQVRFVYALRVAILLALGLYVIQVLDLTYGRWLLFTFASISLPYADDIKAKSKKRIVATLIGCAIGFLCFTLISDITLRTIILTASGYLMFYLSDYATTFTCSTIGALGGSIMSKAFGVSAVANIVGIRIFYIAIGIVIALLVNMYIFPFYREKAAKQLAQKYMDTSVLLQKICQEEQVDSQLYYNLIIQIFLQEETLRNHAHILQWTKINEFLENIQKDVRLAHRNYKYRPSH